LEDAQVLVPRGTLHICRSKFLWKKTLYERLRISNYGSIPIDVQMELQFGSDFVDIFEVRGLVRPHRGYRLEDQFEDNRILLAYQGLDGITRTTVLEWWPAAQASGAQVRFEDSLLPREEKNFYFTVSCRDEEPLPKRVSYEDAAQRLACHRKTV